MEIFLVVFSDATHCDVLESGRSCAVGWFRDEIEAIAAAGERVLLQSAIVPELRRLPELQIHFDYRITKSGHHPARLRRGIHVTIGSLGRRTVRLPCSNEKAWLDHSQPT